MPHFPLFAVLISLSGFALAQADEKNNPPGPVRKVLIKTLTAQMKYDVDSFTVRPGERVKLTLENGDDLPHNIVFCKPGTDTVAMSLKQMSDPETALKRDWVPEDTAIWLHSRMLNPHQQQSLEFTAPEKPGDYPYVCTFPGHALTMKGMMKVLPAGGGLRDLKFALYLGAWKKLPDFTKLQPHREGVVEDNLIQLKLDGYKNEFGVVFTGTLEAPRQGEYHFYITGDDGVRLLVDGKMVAEHDGIHPAQDIKEGSVKLDKGAHKVRLEYFQAGGGTAVFAAWKGEGFDITPLSAWLPDNMDNKTRGKKKADFAPIPLVAGNEPVIYRNFITGAGNRAIAVGYPGGVNLAWSAEQMNLALIWRGAFIDAARHWNNRGGGAVPPLGYDVAQPAFGPPLAVLASADAAWPETKERAEDCTWKGYRLDEQRHPVFQYEWNGVRVEERFEAEDGRLKRVLALSGVVPENTWLRLAAGRTEPGANGAFSVTGETLKLDKLQSDNRCLIQAEGAMISPAGLLLLVKTAGHYEITYSWPGTALQ